MTNKEFALIIINLIKDKCTQTPMDDGYMPYLKLNLDNEETYGLFNQIMNLAKDIEALNRGEMWN